jgi:hypothetical protein
MEFPVFERTHGYLLDYDIFNQLFVKNLGPNFEDDGLIGWIVSDDEDDVDSLVNAIWYHRKYHLLEDDVPGFDDLKLEIVRHWK